MPTIKCLNRLIRANQKRPCLKFLGIIPECVKDALKSNPGEKLILRCPACAPDVRWIAIFYDEGFVFEAMDKPVFDDNMVFDRIEDIEQVA